MAAETRQEFLPLPLFPPHLKPLSICRHHRFTQGSPSSSSSCCFCRLKRAGSKNSHRHPWSYSFSFAKVRALQAGRWGGESRASVVCHQVGCTRIASRVAALAASLCACAQVSQFDASVHGGVVFLHNSHTLCSAILTCHTSSASPRTARCTRAAACVALLQKSGLFHTGRTTRCVLVLVNGSRAGLCVPPCSSHLTQFAAKQHPTTQTHHASSQSGRRSN